MKQIRTCPVKHRHEVVADAMDAFSREVAQAFLIDFYLLVAVGAAVLDGLHHRQTLHHAPAHSIGFNILSQVANFLTCPYFAEGHIMKGCHYALHADLFQHGKRNLVFLAKPSPGSFHSLILFMSNMIVVVVYS